LKIPSESLEAVHRRTNNTMAKWKRPRGNDLQDTKQKLRNEQHELVTPERSHVEQFYTCLITDIWCSKLMLDNFTQVLSFDVRLLVTRLVSSKSFMLSLYKIYNVIHFVGLFKDNHFAHKDYFVYTDLVIIGAVTWIFSNCCRVTSIPLTLPSLCGNTINQLSEHF
jgi:hypothetical protein